MRAHLLFWSLCGLLTGAVWGWAERQTTVEKNAGASTRAAEAKAPKTAAATPSAAVPKDAGEGGQLRLLERIASASREDLVALSRELCNDGTDRFAISFLWDRWIEVDPEGGFRALMDGELVSKDRMPQVWEYLGKWSVMDPDTAMARAMSLPEDYDQNIASDRISAALAAKHPADFFRRYAELSKRDGATFYVQTAAAKLALTDPQALVSLLQGPSANFPLADSEKAKAWQSLAAGWARSDPQAALNFFRTAAVPPFQGPGLDEIATQVIAADPNLAAEITKESHGTDSVKKAAKALAATDPDAALAWLKQHFPEEPGETAFELARTHIPRTAQEAVDYMVRHTDVLFGPGKGASGLLSQFTVDNPAAALALTEAIGDPVTRSRIRSLTLDLLAVSSPEEAIKASASDPGRGGILNTAVANWAKENLTAASAWVTTQPPGADRDQAIAGLLNVTLRVEPDSALPWAAAISDAPARIAKLAWVLSRTGKQSEEEVTSALAALSVPPEEITKVFRDMKANRRPR